MDRPLSRASTLRPQDTTRTPSSAAEREDFLTLALQRLHLTPRPTTPRLLLAPVPASEGLVSDVDQGAKTMQTLGSVTSPATDHVSSAGRTGEGSDLAHPQPTFCTLSGTHTSSFTEGLTSRDEAESYADEVVQSFLSEESSLAVIRSAKEERLIFYQALVVQFGLREPEEVPTTATQCCKLLSDVHICLREYLSLLERGDNVRTELKRHETAHDLRKYLWAGPKEKK
ncbi:hypothetical protein JCM11641_004720 [Rhodosporidiobolus odoratus]